MSRRRGSAAWTTAARATAALVVLAVVALARPVMAADTPSLDAPALRDTAPLTAALAELARGDVDAARRGVEALAASEDPRALAVLRALRDGDALVDEHHVVIRRADGTLVDPLSGAATAATAPTTPALDNGIRRALGPAIARLELRSADAATRATAVQELARRPTEGDGALLRAALAGEHDPRVRSALADVVARLDLESTEPERRLSALAAIEASGSSELRPKVEALVARTPDASFVEPDPRVRAAAERTLAALARRQMRADAVASLVHGLSTGSILLLSALGLAVTFGLMGIINMAHGEMLMLGAYATYATQRLFRTHLASHADAYLLVAVPMAFVVCSLVGAVLERLVVRRLYGRPLESLLATWGLSLILLQSVRTIFGAQNVTVENPSWLAGGWPLLEGVVVPKSRVATLVFAASVVAFVAYLLRGTSLGLRVRAVTQNRSMAACLGIPTGKVDTWTFALGSGLGGLGGVALSQIGNVGPELGQAYIVDTFLVVVLGGVGKLAGTLVAALGLGLVQQALEPFAGAVAGKIAVLVGVVMFIQWRPRGLFATSGRNAEAGS